MGKRQLGGKDGTGSVLAGEDGGRRRRDDVGVDRSSVAVDPGGEPRDDQRVHAQGRLVPGETGQSQDAVVGQRKGNPQAEWEGDERVLFLVFPNRIALRNGLTRLSVYLEDPA